MHKLDSTKKNPVKPIPLQVFKPSESYLLDGSLEQISHFSKNQSAFSQSLEGFENKKSAYENRGISTILKEKPGDHCYLGASHWTRGYFKSHFAPAFYFLAPHRRRALKLLYAVFRLLDDAVDKGHNRPEEFLNAWKAAIQEKKAAFLVPYNQVNLAEEYLEMIKIFDIPTFSLIDFIDKGMKVDLGKTRFQTAMDLESYCYGVAGTVGLACLPIFGVPWQEAKEFAVRLGITVQWINAIRDVGADAKLGRLYLPLDHLEQFGVAESDIMQETAAEPFLPLLRYETQVARSHYKRAMELLPPRWEHELLPAKIMGKIYSRLLDKLEDLQYPVFRKRVALNLWEKGLATLRAVRE